MRDEACAAVLARSGELAALSAERAPAEEPHLVVCAACRDEIERTRAVLARLDRLAVREPARDLSDPVMARIAAAPGPAWFPAQPRAVPIRPQPAARSPQPIPPEPGFFAFANARALALPSFAVALAVALFVLIRPSPGPRLARHTPSPSVPAVESEPVVPGGEVTLASLTGGASAFEEGAWKELAAGRALGQGRRIRTHAGAKAALVLPDGSRIDLAAETEVIAFADRVRLRRGRARFDIRHRPERIFRVPVPDGEVRVLGTLFDVESRAQGTRVHLLHGRLEVQCGRAVERLEDGDAATIAGTALAKIASAPPLAPLDLYIPETDPGTSARTEEPSAPDEPASVGADPKPAIEATAATGPAPAGIHQ